MQVSLQINSDKKHALIGHFQVALNLIIKAMLHVSAKVFIMKINLNFIHMQTKLILTKKNFALIIIISLDFIMRSTATRKWPI